MGSLRLVREGPLTVRIDQDGDSFAVRAAGELGAATAPALEGSLRTVLQREASSISLDLTEVRSIDSTGVRVLLWAAEHASEIGERLNIRCGSDAVHRMIELAAVEPGQPQTA